MCDQAKAVLVQNCSLAVSLGLQSKKSLDEYAQDICQSKQGELLLDGGMIRLPDPYTPTEGWEDSPSSLPNIGQTITIKYKPKSWWSMQRWDTSVLKLPLPVTICVVRK